MTDFIDIPFWPAFNVADICVTLGVLSCSTYSRDRPAMRIEVPAEAAGERLDVFLASHAGSRAAAQRLIDGGLVPRRPGGAGQALRAARR